MDFIKIQERIEELISDIGKARKSIRQFAKEKAEKLAEYEKDIAKTILLLQNGQIEHFDKILIGRVTATNVEKIARGICWKQKMEADLADSNYKAAIVAIECLKSELNGYQSIIKYSEFSTND